MSSSVFLAHAFKLRACRSCLPAPKTCHPCVCCRLRHHPKKPPRVRACAAACAGSGTPAQHACSYTAGIPITSRPSPGPRSARAPLRHADRHARTPAPPVRRHARAPRTGHAGPSRAELLSSDGQAPQARAQAARTSIAISRRPRRARPTCGHAPALRRDGRGRSARHAGGRA